VDAEYNRVPARPSVTRGIGAGTVPIEIHIRDEVQTRKPHACGSDRWRIYRVGADIGMICLGCQRRVMLPRRKFERSVKKRFPAGETSG